jgi:hypothetical protein
MVLLWIDFEVSVSPSKFSLWMNELVLSAVIGRQRHGSPERHSPAHFVT